MRPTRLDSGSSDVRDFETYEDVQIASGSDVSESRYARLYATTFPLEETPPPSFLRIFQAYHASDEAGFWFIRRMGLRGV